MTGPSNEEQLVELVLGLVERELERLGRSGPLRSEGRWLVYGKGATQTRAEVQGSPEQWESLPDDLRERRARQIAEFLMAQPASAPARPPPQRLSNRPRWWSVIAPLFVVAATALVIALAYRLLSPRGANTGPSLSQLFGLDSSAAPSASASASGEAEHSLSSLFSTAAGACDRVRARAARGATVGPADVEGWQVELVLLRRGPAADLSRVPALGAFLRSAGDPAKFTWIWPNAKSLVSAERYDAQVEVRALPPLGAGQLSGVRFVFSGPYVGPYFSEQQRSDFLLLADGLSEALSATDGALFAHCANADAHSIGSWFLGANPGAAMASLVYFMAGYSDFPVLKPEVLGSGDETARRGHAFDVINQSTAGIDRAHAATLLGRELGMISGRPNKPSRLTFPFRDASRAQRSSLQVARAMGLATGG